MSVTWIWKYEHEDGTEAGTSEGFDNRSDAETWLGVEFDNLVERGVDRVYLLEDGEEVYGPMSLHLDS